MTENINTVQQPVIETLYKNSFRSLLDQIVMGIANTIILFLVCAMLCFTIIGILAIPAAVGGYTESMIRLAKGENVGIGDFLKLGFSKFGTLLGAGILSVIGIGIGLLCFIIPGIYLMIRWFFVVQLIVDKDFGISDAFRKSGEMIDGIFWEVLAVMIINVVINSLGWSIGIGAFITTPFVTLVCAYYYLHLIQNIPVAEVD